MDKETMMLELVGLSRVVDGEVRELIHKSYVLGNLADNVRTNKSVYRTGRRC